MRKNRSAVGNRSRDGIALVVVLGFLSVLLIMAVGFVIAMRTERMAARNFADVVRARQLVHAGLARAMSEIDQEMTAPPAVIYPPWDVLTSTNQPFTTNAPNILSGDASNFIPRSLWRSATSAVPGVVWATINDPVSGQLIGRYAYLAVDCSGLLDASTVGGGARGKGTNSNEIILTHVPEMNQAQIPTFFQLRSNSWKRFESLPDLHAVATNQGLRTYPSNLFVYSRFPPPKRPDGLDPVNISGTDQDLAANEGNIKSALTQAGVPNVDQVFYNLLEYVDANDVPDWPDPDAALASFNTEAVPMINEIVVSNRLVKSLVGTDTQYVHDIFITVETWHPFPGAKTVELTPSPLAFNFSGPSAPASLLPVPAEDYFIGPGAKGAPVVINHSPFSFRTNAFVYRRIETNSTAQLLAFQLIFSGNIELRLPGGGGVVDRVNLGSLPANVFQLGFPGLAGQPVGANNARGSQRAASVADPRFNHLISSGRGISDNGGWFLENATLGTTNFAVANTPMGEGPSEMFVRNGPLQSVAELGYLNVGEPWRTIALYMTAGNRFHPVLDYFTVRPPQTNSLMGLVNPNTLNPIVMGSVLVGAPIERFPGQTNFITTWTAAYNAATAIIATRTNEFTGVSQIGVATSYFAAPGFINEMTTDARRESFIRNSYELFSLRQNLFTIIVAAQATDTNANVLAEQRAVAVVWRDPYRNANGNHVSFVRFFKWLTF